MIMLITWTYPDGRRYEQIRQLVNVYCKADKKDYFTMNSPIYKAIADGSMFINLGYGDHHFTITELDPTDRNLK